MIFGFDQSDNGIEEVLLKERENDTVDDRGIVTFVNVIPLKGEKGKLII